MVTWADRQIAKVRNFAIAPREGFEVTVFSTEEIVGKQIMVVREYRKPEWHDNFGYKECFIIGVRGAVKTIYSKIY